MRKFLLLFLLSGTALLYGYPRGVKVVFYVNDGAESAMFRLSRPGYMEFIKVISKRFKKPAIVSLKTSNEDGTTNLEVVTEANYDDCMYAACQRNAGFIIES